MTYLVRVRPTGHTWGLNRRSVVFQDQFEWFRIIALENAPVKRKMKVVGAGM